MNENIKAELRRELSYAPIIENLLANYAGIIHRRGFKVFELKKASPEEDSYAGFDFVFQMGSFTVPVRIRRPDCRYRDFTVRSRSRNGGKTEIHKLREGMGDLYFYAWSEDFMGVEKMAEFALIDLNSVRAAGLLTAENVAHLREISNGDGTSFISFSLKELAAAQALIAHKKV